MSRLFRPRTHAARAPAAAARAILGLAFLLSAFSLSGCATNPATGQKEFTLVSQGQEISMGQEGDKAVQAEYGLYEDPQLQAYVDRIGQKLASVSERPDLQWHFRIVDSPVVNAFALPGGYIYVTRGILAVMNSEAQLAGVMGHEIGHVTARHSARQLTRASLANLGLGLGSIFIGGFQPYGQAASAGLQLLFLKYSRGDETQADALGVRYATRAGYDPREIPNTYIALGRLAAKSSQHLPNFLETHPDPGNREATTRRLAEQAIAGKDKSTLIVAANEYKHQIDGLVYGDDPRSGYVENGVFYHPALRFQVRFPSGWQVQNSQQSVTAVSSGQNQAVQLSLVPDGGAISPSDYVRRLQSQNQIIDARGGPDRVGGYNAWVGQVTASNGQSGQSTLYAAWVKRDSGRLYQFLAAPVPGAGSSFTSTLDSFRDLNDASKLNRQPNRVDLVTVTQASATVSQIARSVSRLAISVDDVAFLNNLDPGSTVRRGFELKVVRGPTQGS